MRWRNVTLIGVGLLGGSLGLALKRRALVERVTGFVRREASVQESVSAGAVDVAFTELRPAVEGADLVVFCTPLWQMSKLAKEIGDWITPGAVITDVGSVKRALVDDLEPFFAERGAHFVGSHPMAGSEKMGVGAAREDLFERACCVVTPGARVSGEAVERVEALWRSVGGRPLRMDPDVHDELVARSSHLPHVLAAHLASYVLGPEFPADQRRLCAGGFKDSTRVAAGSPEMWRDIVTMNREHVGAALKDFVQQLEDFQARLERNDPGEIEAFFQSAKMLRDGWAAQCATSSPE